MDEQRNEYLGRYVKKQTQEIINGKTELAGEDPLEKGMATLSSILAWQIPWTEEPGGLQSMVAKRNRHETNTFTFFR